MNLNRAESLLATDSRLQPRPLHDEGYELTYASRTGRQITLNRKSSATAVRLWIETSIDPRLIGLSDRAEVVLYPADKPRAHLSASRLTGPYKTRAGNDAWYVAIKDESDFTRLLDAYLGSY